MDGYLFLDVEWADAKRHICSIAYQRTSYDGALLDSRYQLVNPLCDFDPMTQRVHGITEEMVAQEPTFDMVWNDELGELIESNVVVAHCAKTADCPALYRSLESFEMELPRLLYIDTGEMAKQVLGGRKYGLSTCCDYYGISLDQHHDALCDTNACRELFWRLAQEIEVPDPKPYVFGGSAKRSTARWR
ncbi:MAG: exonuclease domain-containing protein [Raoultibacter sp.]